MKDKFYFGLQISKGIKYFWKKYMNKHGYSRF